MLFLLIIKNKKIRKIENRFFNSFIFLFSIYYYYFSIFFMQLLTHFIQFFNCFFKSSPLLRRKRKYDLKEFATFCEFSIYKQKMVDDYEYRCLFAKKNHFQT